MSKGAPIDFLSELKRIHHDNTVGSFEQAYSDIPKFDNDHKADAWVEAIKTWLRYAAKEGFDAGIAEFLYRSNDKDMRWFLSNRKDEHYSGVPDEFAQWVRRGDKTQLRLGNRSNTADLLNFHLYEQTVKYLDYLMDLWRLRSNVPVSLYNGSMENGRVQVGLRFEWK